MNQFGDIYSDYYDLLYKDKNYLAEVDYIDMLLKKFGNGKKDMLDLGCGTGRHDEIFADKSYSVHGVDISEPMLSIAKKRVDSNKNKLSFTQSDITELKLGKRFNNVISLFHVLSYQDSNEKLKKVFNVVYEHLEEQGLFIFDFWYGPAVLTDKPTTRIKRFENQGIEVTRISEANMHCMENIVDVNFDILIKEKKTGTLIQKKECHRMRYLFDTELELICESMGFTISAKYECMTEKEPSYQSWNVVWILQK